MATPNLSTITTVTPKILGSLQLSSGDNTVYTVPGSKAAKLATLTVTNVTGSAVTVSVSVVPSGGSVDTTHKIVNAYSLAGNDALLIDDVKGMWLGDGDKVSINAGTGSAVDATLTGLEFA